MNRSEPVSREEGHTAEERQVMLEKMQTISNQFYNSAVFTGCHPFIEFCGLMNKYIDLCRAAHKEGIDFAMSNTHTGDALPVAAHDMAYLAEKLDCIFGPTLRSNPDAREAFLQALNIEGSPLEGLVSLLSVTNKYNQQSQQVGFVLQYDDGFWTVMRDDAAGGGPWRRGPKAATPSEAVAGFQRMIEEGTWSAKAET